MPEIVLGNVAPIEIDPKADPISPRPKDRKLLEIDNGRDDNRTYTTFAVPANAGLIEALQTISSAYRSHHSDAAPVWVEGNDEELVKLVAREFTTPDHHVVIGMPEGWLEGEEEYEEAEELDEG